MKSRLWLLVSSFSCGPKDGEKFLSYLLASVCYHRAYICLVTDTLGTIYSHSTKPAIISEMSFKMKRNWLRRASEYQNCITNCVPCLSISFNSIFVQLAVLNMNIQTKLNLKLQTFVIIFPFSIFHEAKRIYFDKQAIIASAIIFVSWRDVVRCWSWIGTGQERERASERETPQMDLCRFLFIKLFLPPTDD